MGFPIFRELDEAETREFQTWARQNHKPGDVIAIDLWHPVVVEECHKIDRESNVEIDTDVDTDADSENTYLT